MIGRAVPGRVQSLCYMGGVRPGAGFESPAAMPRRWLAGIFAIFAVWAILVAVFSTDNMHQRWGAIAAVGYGLALHRGARVRHNAVADVALRLAFLGGLVVPLACSRPAPEAARGHGGGQVRREPDPPRHPVHGRHTLAGTSNPNTYNPYLPVMALFGLPRAFFDLGCSPTRGSGSAWCSSYLLARAAPRRRARPRRWTVLVAASPVIAFELAVGGTDVPMVAFLCLGFAYLWDRKPVLAGLALGVGASMKATAWPALLVAIALLAVREASGRCRAFTLTALAVVAVLRRPVRRRPPAGAGGEHDQVPARAGRITLARPSPLPGHLIAPTGRTPGTRSSWRCSALAGPRRRRSRSSSGRRGRCRARSLLLAGAMTLMFVLAPSTRFGYFIYPAALAIWVLAARAGRRRAATTPARRDPGGPPASSRTRGPTSPVTRPAA